MENYPQIMINYPFFPFLSGALKPLSCDRRNTEINSNGDISDLEVFGVSLPIDCLYRALFFSFPKGRDSNTFSDR